MTTLATVEKLALELPEQQRATLASHILHSLPGMFSEEDEGEAEAERRDSDLQSNPSIAISLLELDHQIAGRRST